jgi:hypothetical protein
MTESRPHWRHLHLCPTGKVVEVRIRFAGTYQARCSEGHVFWTLTDGRQVNTHPEDTWRPCKEQV